MDTLNSEKVQKSISDFCEGYGLILISADKILKGNKVKITVRNPNEMYEDGNMKPFSTVIGYGTQEIEMEKYIFNVIRMTCDGSESIDNISLYNFNSLKDARKWIKADASNLASCYGFDLDTDSHFSYDDSKMYFFYNNNDCDSSEGVLWQIRKLPLQTSGEWNDPEYNVRFKRVVR